MLDDLTRRLPEKARTALIALLARKGFGTVTLTRRKNAQGSWVIHTTISVEELELLKDDVA